MATVSIPTILRTHTGGEKTVEAQGRHRSPRSSTTSTPAHRAARPADHRTATLHRFVNIYVNDEDVRFTGGLETPVTDGDRHDPAGRRRRHALTPRSSRTQASWPATTP